MIVATQLQVKLRIVDKLKLLHPRTSIGSVQLPIHGRRLVPWSAGRPARAVGSASRRCIRVMQPPRTWSRAASVRRWLGHAGDL